MKPFFVMAFAAAIFLSASSHAETLVPAIYVNSQNQIVVVEGANQSLYIYAGCADVGSKSSVAATATIYSRDYCGVGPVLHGLFDTEKVPAMLPGQHYLPLEQITNGPPSVWGGNAALVSIACPGGTFQFCLNF